jgi:ACS family hexuronate transporter-like MFS transporter
MGSKSEPISAGGTGASAQASVSQADSPLIRAVGHYRWIICALLFFAATINYVDRQVLALLKTEPTFQSSIKWTEVEYGHLIFVFQLAYAIALMFAGKVMDWLGTRKGFSVSVFFWSVAAMAHALAKSVFGFGVARFALGLGESGNFPASIKAVAEWFPKKERALATGVFNSGTNFGAMLTPPLVAWVTASYGWQAAFIATGALGFLWLVFWLALYRPPEEHSRVSKAELEYIRSDPPEAITKVPWLQLIPHRQTWAFAIGKFMTDPIWWFFLFWGPDFLHKTFGVTLSKVSTPLFVIYLIATVGSVGGGQLSSSLLKRGWSVNAARKTAMLLCALAVVPVPLASRVSNMWAAIGLIGLALAAHQGWSANLFTLTSDTFPRRAVGSVVGFGGMFGSLGALLLSEVAGHVLQWTGSYLPLFIISGSAYLTALLIIHLLVPTLRPAGLDDQRTT